MLYQLVAKMVHMSPALSAAIACKDGTKQLTCPERGTVYRALSAEASTAYGAKLGDLAALWLSAVCTLYSKEPTMPSIEWNKERWGKEHDWSAHGERN